VTDVSGRGVGLDVVRNKIEAFGGRIELDSKLGKGVRYQADQTFDRIPGSFYSQEDEQMTFFSKGISLSKL